MIGEIEENGFLEGGDFTPAGQDLALLGIGLRSNMEAAQQLMDKDLLGSRRFAVVRDDFEQHQVLCSTGTSESLQIYCTGHNRLCRFCLYASE